MEEKLRSDMDLARQRVGIGPEDPILAEHVCYLTGRHINAVAFCQLQVRLKGSVAQTRNELVRLLSTPPPQPNPTLPTNPISLE